MSGDPTQPADGHSDAALVALVLDGDRTAFAEVYDRYADRLYDFAHSMLRNTEDASDAVADAFVVFAERLKQLREPDRLRPWLYAIVRTECLRRLKSRKRFEFGGDEQLVDMADTALAPDEQFETAALRQLVWDAAGGLAERDRALLDLHLRQGLDGAELGEAMGVSANNAYVMMNRLRGQLERSLGALLIAKAGRDACGELDTSLGDWDGSFSPLIRKRVARHVDGCARCTAKRAAMVSPLSLFAGVSAFAAPAGLRDRVLDNFGHGVTPNVADASSWVRRSVIGGAAAAIIVLAVLLAPGHIGEGNPVTNVDASASATPIPTPTASSSTTLPTPTTRPTVAPSRLDISNRSLTFAYDDSTHTTRLTNRGGRSLRFALSPQASWVSVSQHSGRLDPGDSTTVTVYVSRGRWLDDRHSRISVKWDHGTDSISVRVKAYEPTDDKTTPPTEEPPTEEPTQEPTKDGGDVVIY